MDTNVEMIKSEDEKSVICSTCKKTYKLQLAYTRHINSCKMSHNQCSMCSTKFSSNEQLKEHIIQSHEGKVFVCPYEDCYIAYATKKGLKYHQGTHAMKQFNCSTCSLSFNSSEELQTHKKNPEHKNYAKRAKCSGCGKVYNSKHEAEWHFDKSCLFNPDRIVKCFVCMKMTGKAKDFLEHLKEKHNSAAVCICTRCLLSFPNAKSKEKHLETCKIET